MLKIVCVKNFSWFKIFAACLICEILLTVDDYNMDKRLELSKHVSQVKLTATLWLSGIVVDRTFTLGGVDMCARLFVDRCCVNAFIHVLNFRDWSQP